MEEKKEALQQIMSHYSDRTDWVFSDAEAAAVAIIRLDVLDVGQSQALLLRLPGHVRLLLDGGGSASPRFDPGQALVAPALAAWCGDASVAGGKKVCAVRRIRACATRNRMPFRKNFLARVQAAGAVVAEVARRSRQPRNIIGAPDHDEEKARFPDVFFSCVRRSAANLA